MKDASHHLKQLQKKVIQSQRKENGKEVETPLIQEASTLRTPEIPRRKFDQNHRVPRILKRQPVF